MCIIYRGICVYIGIYVYNICVYMCIIYRDICVYMYIYIYIILKRFGRA